ncbi:hypothetical protein LWI28_016516 [Acer negundo]|uniref:Uncharacterized protein n=1 Tax=Acer negundo TaxID=4023 RepID=A0AAD5JTZ6_ACENE|nr:hypothetical protein LWI28_016516 [Acer negundo]
MWMIYVWHSSGSDMAWSIGSDKSNSKHNEKCDIRMENCILLVMILEMDKGSDGNWEVCDANITVLWLSQAQSTMQLLQHQVFAHFLYCYDSQSQIPITINWSMISSLLLS